MKQLLIMGICLFVFPLMPLEEKPGVARKKAQIKTVVLPTSEANKDGAIVNGYRKSTDNLNDVQFKYVIYTPVAIPKPTRLPVKLNAQGILWPIVPRTHVAHIMIWPFS